MEKVASFLRLAPYVVIVLSLGEFALVQLTTRGERDPRESLANFAVWLINRPLYELATGGLFLGVLIPISKLTPLKLPVTGWTVVLTMLVADFIYYWTHRLSHEIRLLWAYHSVHHSSKEYNLSTAVRLPWFGTIGDVMFYIPAVLLGFSPVLLVIGKIIVLLYQYWIHTQSIGKLGWFDRFFNSPSNHRVHHGSNAVYLDRNHAGILMIWDRIFGTYQEELATEPVVYGLTKPLNSYNPLIINLYEPLALIRDVRRAASIGEAMKFVFKGPGWAPGNAGAAPLARGLPRSTKGVSRRRG